MPPPFLFSLFRVAFSTARDFQQGGQGKICIKFDTFSSNPLYDRKLNI
jgi:hypothetical protein